MTSLGRTAEALRQRGFTVSVFETAEAAADYLDGAIDGRTVGFGGSMTLTESGMMIIVSYPLTVPTSARPIP